MPEHCHRTTVHRYNLRPVWSDQRAARKIFICRNRGSSSGNCRRDIGIAGRRNQSVFIVSDEISVAAIDGDYAIV